MPDLTLLREELTDLDGKYRRLEGEAGTTPRPEQRAQLESWYVRMGQVRDLIEQEADRKRREDMDGLHDWMERPNRLVTHAVNNDDDGKRELMGQGWETRNGVIHIPTSDGQMYPLCPEGVLFGPVPTDPKDASAAEYMRMMRGAVQPIYRRAYEHYLRETIRFRSEHAAMMQLPADEQRALSEGLDAAGGYAVPPDVQAELLQRTAQQSVMRRIARIVTTSRDKVEFPAIAAASTNASIYSSGFTGTWAVEVPAFSDTDPAFQNFTVNVKKLRVATRLSNDFIADAIVDILAWLAANGSTNMALTEDNGFIAGDGIGASPLGLLNCGASTTSVEGTTTDHISNSASDFGSLPKIMNLAYSLPSQYAGNASWVMQRATEGEIRGLAGGAGFIAVGGLTGGFGRWDRAIDGAPVYNSEWMQAVGTNANKVIAYGDFSNYIIAQRAQITTTILRERFADTDQTGIIIFERVGGGVWNTDAFRFGIV